MLKILIADDHELVRKGIKQILLEEFSSLEIKEVFDTDSLIAAATQENWNLIISDISMPGGGGIEGLSQILARVPTHRVLIISVYPPDQYAIQALRAGAFGFLNKDTAPEELINAVKTILFGYRYVHPLFAEKMGAMLLEKAGLLPHELLSHMEREVMMQFIAGFSVEQISKQLGISQDVIDASRSRIMQKISIDTPAELEHYAKKNRLI
jgi:DNA-binding NarL/FixJ family response regulator